MALDALTQGQLIAFLCKNLLIKVFFLCHTVWCTAAEPVIIQLRLVNSCILQNWRPAPLYMYIISGRTFTFIICSYCVLNFSLIRISTRSWVYRFGGGGDLDMFYVNSRFFSSIVDSCILWSTLWCTVLLCALYVVAYVCTSLNLISF